MKIYAAAGGRGPGCGGRGPGGEWREGWAAGGVLWAECGIGAAHMFLSGRNHTQLDVLCQVPSPHRRIPVLYDLET